MNTNRALLAVAMVVGLLSPSQARGQSFTLDDNPTFPLTGPPGFGFGAEDPFGIALFPGLAPSPSLGILLVLDSDILAPGPVLHLPTPDGFYNDSLSNNNANPTDIRLAFSVDRLSLGVPASAVSVEAGLMQQPSDIYGSTDLFVSPGVFAGALGPGPFAGFLPAPLGGPASNVLLIDDSALGLLSGGAVVPPGVPAPPIFMGTHDNVDAFDHQLMDADGDGLNDGPEFFTIYPDEAVGVGVSAADIFDVAPGAVGTSPVPYAPAPTMGLDFFGPDSIDALVVYDNGLPLGPRWGGPGGEPGIDYALFSLAPGSASLAVLGLTAADVFFTDFTGAFAVYAPDFTLGLVGIPGGPVGIGDNIDALEVPCMCGDLDGSGGNVNLVDFAAFAFCFGSSPSSSPACAWSDMNLDGVINLLDFSTFLLVFNTTPIHTPPFCP